VAIRLSTTKRRSRALHRPMIASMLSRWMCMPHLPLPRQPGLGRCREAALRPSGSCAACLPRDLSACLRLKLSLWKFKTDEQAITGRFFRRECAAHADPQKGSAVGFSASRTSAVALRRTPSPTESFAGQAEDCAILITFRGRSNPQA
jgi:hypothetical protein